MSVQMGPMPTHGLHGPPPQPTQPETAPRETLVRVRNRPVPSEPAAMNLKNWRRDERRASILAAWPAMSIGYFVIPALIIWYSVSRTFSTLKGGVRW
jgi:hypothetical protein